MTTSDVRLSITKHLPGGDRLSAVNDGLLIVKSFSRMAVTAAGCGKMVLKRRRRLLLLLLLLLQLLLRGAR